MKIDVNDLQPGIIYISFLPPRMTVKKVREIFSRYGETERIFLDPNKDQNDGYFKINSTNGPSKGTAPSHLKHTTKQRHGKQYTEGWVEFKDKRKAKRAASMLNGSPIEIHKRRTPYAGMLWNVKYLSGFKWSHLAEQAAYERAAREQALRTEVSKVKKETQYYVEKREHEIKKNRSQSSKASHVNDTPYPFSPALRHKSSVITTNDPPPVHYDENILKSIFT